MSDDVLLVVDFNSVCRFCLQSSGALSSIFDEDEDVSLVSQVLSFTDIKVDPDDCFPSKICHRCRYRMEVCSEFKEMISRTHKALMENVTDEIFGSQESPEMDALKDNLEYSEDTEDHANKNDEETVYSVSKDNSNIYGIENDEIIDENETNNKSDNSNDTEAVMEMLLERDKRNYQNAMRKKMNNPSSKVTEYPSMMTAMRLNQCLLCLEKCGETEALRKHVDEHIEGTDLEPYYLFGERDIKCKPCDRLFGYRFNFLEHQRQHLNIKPFICSFDGCEMAFYSSATLRQHMPIHAERKFICVICNVRFKRKSDLRGHEIIHKDAGLQFHCPVCQLICKNRLTLAAHVRKHCETPKFKCLSCPKVYYSRSELQRHVHIHSGEKRFHCASCPSAYYSRTALLRHERGHEDPSKIKVEKRHRLRACPVCPKVLDTRTYKLHLKSHPPSDYMVTCTECGKGFWNKTSLAQHVAQCQSEDSIDPMNLLKIIDLKTSQVQLGHQLREDQVLEDVLAATVDNQQQLLIVDIMNSQIEE